MSTLQFFSDLDELKYFKIQKQNTFRSLFFEHAVNKTVNIGCGTLNGITYEETIITDGEIELNKKNFENPIIIWKNELLKLDEGLSISITIKNASFFINKIKKENDIQYEIHTEIESEELLTKILDYIYNNKLEYFDTNNISLQHPYTIILENIKEGCKKTDYIDFSPNWKKKKKKKYKSKNC